jgi:hypothetical protein
MDAIDSEQFQHCLPDLEGVIAIKTWDIDGFLVGMRPLSEEPAAQCGPCCPAPRPKGQGPTPHRGRGGNGGRRDPPWPARHRRAPRSPRPVVTKSILSGIGGPDAKLVLGDFDTGDFDSPMAAHPSRMLPGHEVGRRVASDPAPTGPEASA